MIPKSQRVTYFLFVSQALSIFTQIREVAAGKGTNNRVFYQGASRIRGFPIGNRATDAVQII